MLHYVDFAVDSETQADYYVERVDYIKLFCLPAHYNYMTGFPCFYIPPFLKKRKGRHCRHGVISLWKQKPNPE